MVNIMVILTPCLESTAQLQDKVHQFRFNKWGRICSHHNTSHGVHLESVIFCHRSPNTGSSWIRGKQHISNSILFLWTSREAWIDQGLHTDFNLLCVFSTEQLLLFQVNKMSLYFSNQWMQCQQKHYCHLSGFSTLPLALLTTWPGAALSLLEPCLHSPSDTDNITCAKKNVLREWKKSNLWLSTQPGQSTRSMTGLLHL